MPKRRRIHQLAISERPREKLQSKGVASLTDHELLEVLIGNGTASADVAQIAHSIHKLLRRGTGTITYEALTALPGVNIAGAGKVLAALELAKRHLVKDVEPLRTTADIVARLDDIRKKQQEYVVELSLDGGQRLIANRTIAIGTLDAVLVHPREVFADAIVDRAATIVVAHNHPSNDPTPSQADIRLTQDLVAVGQLIGISLYDHIIVTKNNYFSFRLHHLL